MNKGIADELASHFVLFSCEGTAEGVIVEKLFNSGNLVVPMNRVVVDSITFKPFTRQRKASQIENQFFHQNYEVDGAEGLLIARIIDSRHTQFSLSRMNRESVPVRNFITAREIEMLVIHAENAYDDWIRANRQNRQLTPSEYCMSNLGMSSVKREEFLSDYWSDADKLVAAIRAYASKRGKRKSDEYMLANLLPTV